MKNIEFYSCSWETVFLRFNLMMAIIVVGVSLGFTWIVVAVVPFFASALLGLRFTNGADRQAKIRTLLKDNGELRKAS